MRTMIAMATLAVAANVSAATLRFEGAAEKFLPGRVSRESSELQATRHPVQPVVMFGCVDCPGQQGTDVFTSVDRGTGWTEGGRASVSRRGNEALPSFSSDGYWLYYTDDRAGGFGGTDLMRAYFTPYKGTFSPPELLEGSINSAGDEGGAAANDNGLRVIFASKGRPGAKGWDLFESHRAAGKMSKGARLPTIDTAADEFDPALLANDAGLVFARSDAIDAQPSALWFAPRQGDGYGKPVKLGEAVNAPGSSVRGAQQDWSDPAYLLFTRDGDIWRIRYRVVD